MQKDLFFIPIILRALREPDTLPALRRAFDEIRRMGRQPAYRRGYDQFQRFMDAAARHALVNTPHLPALPTADGTHSRPPAPSALAREPDPTSPHRLVQPQPQDDLRSLARRTGPLEIVIRRNGSVVGQFPLEPDLQPIVLPHAAPGQYDLGFDTGRVLWAEQLSDKDLIWSHAYPGRPLLLAARTGDSEREPTRHVSLCDGAIVLSVYPGTEDGILRVELAAGPDRQ